MTIFSKNTRNGTNHGPFAKLYGLWRDARTREAEAIVARYMNGRLTDAAEREMTEKLLHVGDSFRF